MKVFDAMQANSITIYGAQMVAVSVYYAIKELYKDIKINCFVVREKTGNPDSIDGIPVKVLSEFNETNTKIIIATPENYHAAIIADLEAKGFDNYICMDSKAEAFLMEKYYNKIAGFPTLHTFDAGDEKADIAVYMSKFYKDQPLKCHYQIPVWVNPVQAGAALTDVRIAELCDNTGDNISLKNVNYSELSALYWIQKHMNSEYIGLFHYRRILDMKEDDLYRLKKNEIDVILPYPTVHYPNIGEHHKRYLKDNDWEAMLQALKELAPDYARALPDIFSKQYFYNYNMFIAKEHILSDYCNWLFPILDRTEQLSVPKGNERADRYIGYLGENLTTLYFMYHQNDYKIAHTGRLMLI